MNNSALIHNYLNNEMNASEKTAFEERLASDLSLQNELAIQQQLIKAIVHEGIKMEFTNAIRKQQFIQRSITWGAIAAVLILFVAVLLFQFGKTSSDKLFDKNSIAAKDLAYSSLSFVNPPIAGINVPITYYSFDAEKGDTLLHASGSIICFPPLSLVDASGKMVKGKVTISYREFSNPVDFFVSGIPMTYDSAGNKYNFESSGMCEINAFQHTQPLYVNKAAQPEIHLSASNKSPLHNLYYLDTVAKRWTFTGKDKISEIKKMSLAKRKVSPSPNVTDELVLSKPVKPAIASEDRQSFSVEIEPGSFEELFAYNNLKFEVMDESSYRASDAAEHWDNVKLDRGNAEGIYTVTFTNTRRSVSYKVRPVLNGADYESAMKLFKEKTLLYEQSLQRRLQKEQQWGDSINTETKRLQALENAEKNKIEKLNALIIFRNTKMKEKMQSLTKQQKENEIALQNEIAERQKENEAFMILYQENQEKYDAELRLTSEVMRSFAINRFGTWNCDHPQYPALEIPIASLFKNEAGELMQFSRVSVVCKNFNGITQFPANTAIRVFPGASNMLWAVTGSSFYYFTYSDFVNANIQKNTNQFTFKMRKSEKVIRSYQDVKEVAEGL